MTKLMDCPECPRRNVPVRDDANVCSSNCRVKRWRKMKMAGNKRLMDFYYSETGKKRCREIDEEYGGVHIDCLFKGKVFVEQISHGKKPLMNDKDLVFIGTGTDDDCVYV